jgi:N-acetylglucosamine-6-phosphate deacetylase
MKANPNLLAGATKNLLENIEFLLSTQLCSLSEARTMASTRVAEFLEMPDYFPGKPTKGDVVVFAQASAHKIQIREVYKAGKKVFEQPKLKK